MATPPKHRIVRRPALIVAVLILAPLLYGSTFVSAAFLFGAGVIPRLAYSLLCDAVFAPVFSIDGDSGRIEWLMNMAGDAYWLGFSLTN